MRKFVLYIFIILSIFVPVGCLANPSIVMSNGSLGCYIDYSDKE